MKFPLAVGAAAALLSLFSAAAAQTPVVIHDPASNASQPARSESVERFVMDRLLPKARAKWAEADHCTGSDLNVVGFADGSFTKAGASQQAVVYELCQTGNGFANNGIAIVEGGRVVAHFAVEGGWNLDVLRVPDINRNGRDELAIETGGGMHQGYTGTSVTVLEVTETAAKELGVFVVYTNECETPAADKYCDRSYRLTATPGPKPVFFKQKFVNRGTDEKPRWAASGKPAMAKTVGDLNRNYELIK
jgi:hypothetical protein